MTEEHVRANFDASEEYEPKAEASGENNRKSESEHQEGQRPPRRVSPYATTPDGLIWLKPTKEGAVPVPLTNFLARIVAEVERDDGVERTRHFEIEAELRSRRRCFPVAATEFQGLAWISRELGAQALVYAGWGVKDHTRVAIQLLSNQIASRTVFGHTGWRKVGGQDIYLHAEGGIGADGPVPGVETDLVVAGLGGYRLPDSPEGHELHEAVRASLALLEVAPLTVTVPMYAAIWRAPMGTADFSLHNTGLTGVGKTALVALAQQHFGADMDARHLPASWSSTGNAIEAQAFAAKDALLVVDDFAPGGTVHDVARLHREAARVLRAQGNQAGRARLRPDATLRATKPPRGLILSTGEDIPAGQSIRARTLVIEVGPGDVDFDRLTEAQRAAGAGLYAQVMARFLRWMAGRLDRERELFRSEADALRAEASNGDQHRRTPWIIAELGAALKSFIRFAVEVGAIGQEDADRRWRQCWEALLDVGQAQA